MSMTDDAREIRRNIAAILERLVNMKAVPGERSLYRGGV